MVAAWRSRPRRGTGAGSGAGTGLAPAAGGAGRAETRRPTAPADAGSRGRRPGQPAEARRPETGGGERRLRPAGGERTSRRPRAAGDAPEPAPRRKSRGRRTDAERSLRGIVGAGSSQVGVVGAMRARDAARPTAEDLAAAERDLVIVRRHYVPPDTLPGAR